MAKRALKPDTFKTFIEYLFQNFDEKEAKPLANSFVGVLERRCDKVNQGFTCSDHDTTLACWTAGLSEGKNISIDHYNDLFLIKEQQVERIFSDHTSINRFVVSQAILKCLLLIETCYDAGSKLYGYNTDGIYILNRKVNCKHKRDINFCTKKIGKAFRTDDKFTYFEKRYRENLCFDDYKTKRSEEGCIYNGQAGSGKTRKLIQMVIETENPIVCSFTNKAVENV